MAKTTLATVKSFIKKNRANLLISVNSTFDGMVDCVMPCKDKGFTPALSDDNTGYWLNRTQGIKGAWFVGDSRDYFTAFERDGLKGFDVWNSCGSFSLAVKV